MLKALEEHTLKPKLATLLLDIGGTLLTRDKPGTFERCRSWLTQLPSSSIKVSRTAALLSLERSILLKSTRESAVESFAEESGLSFTYVPELKKLVSEAPGNYKLTHGSIQLLDAAIANKWQIIFTTNVCAWESALPAEFLRPGLAVFESHVAGFVKSDPCYWQSVIQKFSVNPLTSFVIGDSYVPDYLAPQQSKLAACHIGQCGSNLSTFVELLNKLGEPPRNAVALYVGCTKFWGENVIIECPHLEDQLYGRTQCYFNTTNYLGNSLLTLIRREKLFPAVIMNESKLGEFYAGWLKPKKRKLNQRVPVKLNQAIANLGFDWNILSDREQHHFLAHLSEAKSQDIFDSRLSDIIATIKHTYLRKN